MNKLQFPLGALALAMMLSAHTCSKVTKENAAQLAQGKWELVELNGKAVTMPEGKEMPYLNIDSLAENLNGFAGCNRIFGEMHLSGDSIAFPGLAATRMYCIETQDVEDAFMGALNRARTYSVKDGRLTLGPGNLAVLRKTD